MIKMPQGSTSRSDSMLRRFSLYGFLKNQQYFEPFLILAFLQRGLSFFLIGLLIGFRELVINLLEIPSGAVADVWGRRKSMILSFCGYIASFAIFGLSRNVPLLFLAMFLFAVGEAFRTGTHKAMIFTWLRSRGRTEEGTKVYGYTRSWSKFGSALSVILAAIFVFATEDYVYIFYFSIIPYLMGIINFLGYPAELDGERRPGASLASVASHIKQSIAASVKAPDLRRLILESMGFQGMLKAAQTYLQPILKSAALIVTSRFVATRAFNEPQRAALLVGPVYFALHILSALASRHAHRLVRDKGREDRTARLLWAMNLLAFAVLLPAMYKSIHSVMIAGFIFLYVLENLWRPVLVSRFAALGDDSNAATLLSIESQSKSVATMIIAPALGLAVDRVKAGELGGPYWPVGALGLAIALIFFATTRAGARKTS